MKSKPSLLIAVFVLGVGCGGDGEKAAAPSVAAPVEAPAAPVAAEAPALDPVPVPTADQLPVPEDFEAQVEGAISAKNYKEQFAELDREIEKDCAQ